MVKALLDTSVIVDMLRGYPPAQSWYLEQDNLGVCQAVWLEIIEGNTDNRSRRDALRLLKRFELVEVTTHDVAWAVEKLLIFNLSHNIDGYDCMIAAVAHRLHLPLYTRNMKHFAPLVGKLAIKPY